MDDEGFGEDEPSTSIASDGIAGKRERRHMQCSHDGCDSPAVYQVFVHLRYGWHLIARESLQSTVKVCAQHKRAANDFILSEHNKANISKQLATIGRLGIDWPNAMIEFVPCGEQSWGPQNMVALATGKA